MTACNYSVCKKPDLNLSSFELNPETIPQKERIT